MDKSMDYWILVVDDDNINLKMATRIFNQVSIKSNVFISGEDFLDFMDANSDMGKLPDLVLLDVHMPGMDGFEVMAHLREHEIYKKIPIIFLTADDDVDTEKRGLAAGASDFIKKPFAAEILLMRVRNTIELRRLQSDMTKELKIKSIQLTRVYMQIVRALSHAVDAKDRYTNGHSTRVAEYSREIAARAGYDDDFQEKIYVAGLLHDIGKIGISNEIINKPARLSDEEYATIKSHPAVGYEILKNISEFPQLSIGARWHHERYDGKGYPDGLVGLEIPEMARIIAVADAYDAMTSYRSYRGVLPQDKVRAEFENNKGTQFDPDFADIMLEIIDEDKNYQKREFSQIIDGE